MMKIGSHIISLKDNIRSQMDAFAFGRLAKDNAMGIPKGNGNAYNNGDGDGNSRWQGEWPPTDNTIGNGLVANESKDEDNALPQ